MTRFTGQVALVTGAARGIGEATARRLSEEGARVVLADVDPRVHEVAAQLPDALACVADVTLQSDVERMVAAAAGFGGRLDVLVCNAGRPFALSSLAATDADWDACLALNLTATWRCVRAAHPHLAASGHGAVVTVASAQGQRSSSRSFPYAAAKGGLLALTRNLAVEFAHEGIRVNAVIPGQVQSVRTDAYFAGFTDPEEARRRTIASFPLGRLGTPEDIAAAIAFLASRDAAWVTGTFLTVDGGRDAALVNLDDLRGDPA